MLAPDRPLLTVLACRHPDTTGTPNRRAAADAARGFPHATNTLTTNAVNMLTFSVREHAEQYVTWAFEHAELNQGVATVEAQAANASALAAVAHAILELAEQYRKAQIDT